ncbi:MAG: sugar phosphate isomerase/epimerase [Deltaproteobacteria bacterium]|nr:sugar phosphate isomerase/epimerase [Deltaproteobacteria bacterium]
MEPIVSINTIAYQGLDLRTALSTAGYSEGFAEKDFSPGKARQLSNMLSEAGLLTVALAAHIDLGTEGAVSAFRRRIDFAMELGAKIVHTNPSQLTKSDLFYRNMEDLAPFAASRGAIIALENPGDGEGSLIGSGKQGVSLIQRVGSDSVRLNYDFCNAFSYSKGMIRPEEELHDNLPYTVHFHLKDMVQQERGWVFSEIGKGVIDYPAIFKFLAGEPEIPPISIEFPCRFRRARDFRPEKNPSPPPLQAIRHVLRGSLEYVRRAFDTRVEPLPPRGSRLDP